MREAARRLWAAAAQYIAKGDKRPAVEFASAFLLSMAGAATLAPFGTAAVAAVWLCGCSPLPALMGAMLGALVSGFYASLFATAMYGVLGLLWYLWREVKREDKFLLLAVANLLGMPIFFFGSTEACMMGLSTLSLSLLSATVLCRAEYGLIKGLKKKLLSEAELMSVCCTTAIFCMATAKFAPFEINVGETMAAFVALCAAGSAGISAVAAAAVLGAGVVLGGTDMPFVGCLALSSLGGALLHRTGKWGTAVAFVGVGFLCAAYVDLGIFTFLEFGIAAVLYAIMPDSFLTFLRASARPRHVAAAEQKLSKYRHHVMETAVVMNDISQFVEECASGEEGRYAVKQFKSISEAMKRLPLEGLAQRQYEIAMGVAGCPKEDSAETGDSVVVREFGSKQLLLLSDGMGSGEAAQRESYAAVTMLSGLLGVGVGEHDALECVNRMLMLRKDPDMYATLDAMIFDLGKGTAKFIKHGAPPSYILRAGKIMTLHAETLPVGILEEAAPGTREVSLMRGDAVVMMTDGAMDALGRELFAALMERVGGANTAQDAAESLLLAARERSGADDMSVIVARIC